MISDMFNPLIFYPKSFFMEGSASKDKKFAKR